MTGDIRSEIVDSIAAQGISVLIKPFLADELLQHIARLHQGSSPGNPTGPAPPNKNAAGCPAAFEIASAEATEKPYSSSSSCFLPPIVFSLANTASTLRSSSVFSLGSNSGSFLVVSEAGSSVAPP